MSKDVGYLGDENCRPAQGDVYIALLEEGTQI